MDRVEVNSRALVSAGWDKGTLEVEYPNGDVYQYSPTSESDFLQLTNPKVSSGSYLATIRRTHQGIKV